MTANREKWKTRVREWRVSGMKAGEYAAGRGFEASTLRYWASQLRHEMSQPPAAPSVQLARVEVVGRRAKADGVVVEVGGARIEVREGFDGALLRDVVHALGGGR